MGRTIIKPERDEDLYVEWSSGVDAPISWGPKSFLQDHDPETFTDARFDRADEYSSSALDICWSWGRDEILIFMQLGIIRRSRLKALTEVLELIPSGDAWRTDSRVLALLDPLE